MKQWLILLNMTIAVLLGISSSTSVIVANPTIIGALVIDPVNSQWLATCYLCMLGVNIPLAPWLAEKYGYKRIFFLGLLIFIIGSGFAGLSYDFISIVLFRTVEGIGAGIFFPISLAIVLRSFPKEKLPLAIALYTGGGFGLGFALGFLEGGLFSQIELWRYIFWTNLLLGIPVLLYTWFFEKESEKKQLPPFDIWGYTTFCIFLITLLIAVTIAKDSWNTLGWTSALTLSCLFTSFVSFICMIIIEISHPNPIIPIRLFRNKTFAICCFTISLIGVMIFGVNGTFPGFLFNNLLYDHLKSGITMIPSAIVLGVVSSLSGFLIRKINVKIVALLGLSIVAISCFLNHAITIQSDHIQIQTVLIGYALGIALCLGSITTMGLSALPSQDAGAGSGLITFFRQMGAAFGGSIIYNISIMRTEFHNQIFGMTMDPNSPGYQAIFRNLQNHMLVKSGNDPILAAERANAAIVKNGISQSQIAAMNDAFFVFGVIISVLCFYFVLDIIFGIYKQKRKAA